MICRDRPFDLSRYTSPRRLDLRGDGNLYRKFFQTAQAARGGVAQSARAEESSSLCRGFESLLRYHNKFSYLVKFSTFR